MNVVAIVAMGLLGLGSSVQAQTLGEAASREKTRRQAAMAEAEAKTKARAAFGHRTLHVPRDEYPAVALSRHIEGVVDLEALVDEGGSVLDVQVARTAYEPFRKAADKSVRQRRHSPLLENGVPVRGWVPIRVYFKLR